MTTFLRDCSHYDLDTSLAGFAGCTHKLTEGRAYVDPAYAGRLPGMRAMGRVLGSYHVLHTTDPAGQLDFWIRQQDALTPWWRDWPHWIMQVDAEKWPGDPVTLANGMQYAGPLHLARNLHPAMAVEVLTRRISTTVAFAGMLKGAGLPGCKIVYASRGQYGDSLTGIPLDLWNAAYRSSTYPGDGAADWAPYSGRTPVLWQYTSTPYDKNAFRGSVADLLAYIEGGGMATGDADAKAPFIDMRVEAIAQLFPQYARVWTGQPVPYVIAFNQLRADMAAVKAAQAGEQAAITALAQAIQAGGGNVDVVAIKQAIADAVAAVHADVTDQLATLRGAIHAAEQAEADALK